MKDVVLNHPSHEVCYRCCLCEVFPTRIRFVLLHPKKHPKRKFHTKIEFFWDNVFYASNWNRVTEGDKKRQGKCSECDLKYVFHLFEADCYFFVS